MKRKTEFDEFDDAMEDLGKLSLFLALIAVVVTVLFVWWMNA
jgi:hypothetical protein